MIRLENVTQAKRFGGGKGTVFLGSDTDKVRVGPRIISPAYETVYVWETGKGSKKARIRMRTKKATYGKKVAGRRTASVYGKPKKLKVASRSVILDEALRGNILAKELRLARHPSMVYWLGTAIYPGDRINGRVTQLARSAKVALARELGKSAFVLPARVDGRTAAALRKAIPRRSALILQMMVNKGKKSRVTPRWFLDVATS